MSLEESKTADSEILIQEYAALINKMGSNESWAYSFVALYFAFLASIGTATGFIFTSSLEKSCESNPRLESGGVLLNEMCVDWQMPYLIILPILGILLNIWAIFMVLDFKRMTFDILNRLSLIEFQINLQIADNPGFATNTLNKKNLPIWRFGGIAVVGSVMVMFFAPWIIVLVNSLN